MTPTILLILAALADIYTSHRAFKAGRVEVNPLVYKLFGKRPSFGAMVAVKVAASAVVLAYGTPAMIYAAAGVWAVVALLNLRR